MAVLFYSFLFLIIIFNACLYVKNENTAKQRDRIRVAISRYNMSRASTIHGEIPFSFMESYHKTLWRLWDWGCMRIVPDNVLSKLIPFLY